MKNNFNFSLTATLLLVIGLSFTSCLKDDCSEVQSFVELNQLWAQPEDFRVPVTTEEAREMETTGKIYYYNNMILINEKYEGVHVIDNTVPASPQNIAFISIPGNIDVTMKGNIMYADSYVDLLTIDLSDINSPQVLCRDEDVFTNYNFNEELGYFIGWIPSDRVEEVDCTNPNFGERLFARQNGGWMLQEDMANRGAIFTSDTNSGAPTTGQAGSFARFSQKGDYLYVINDLDLISYNTSNPEKPVQTNSTHVNWNIETIFPYKDYLFIGSQSGVFIYGLSNPSSPEYLSDFQHAQACDPVFVKDDIAYVTLRDGTWCQNFTNQLDILDVKDIRNPRLIKSYDMQNPHGLSVVNNTLYLCEGSHGLKVFDTENLEEIDNNQLDHVKDFDAYDAIGLSEGHLLVIGKDGLFQFNTSDNKDVKELSFLPVQK